MTDRDPKTLSVDETLKAAHEWWFAETIAPHTWPEGATYEGGEPCLLCGSLAPYGACLPVRTEQFFVTRRHMIEVYDVARALLKELQQQKDSEIDQLTAIAQLHVRLIRTNNEHRKEVARLTAERDAALEQLALAAPNSTPDPEPPVGPYTHSVTGEAMWGRTPKDPHE